jgi:4-hydroxy-tetrahydrodipicolinate reductase
MSGPVRVLLIGAGGRMGKAIRAAADSGFEVTGAERGADLVGLAKGCDVVIDFSTADATEAVCAACAAQKRPLVLGTTGHTDAQKEAVRATAEQVAVVFAANFSLGVNVLFALSRKTATLLGENFDVEVIEAHHKTKKDAPSGTAKHIAEILEEVRGSSVPVHSIRAGGIVGDHEVIFAGSGEQLALTHRASSRATFAEGALHAARWVVDQPASLYKMEDVLGL